MIEFDRHVLKNGMRVLLHEDKATPLAALSLIYDVGSKDDDPEKTGTAHLFEHLMFSGTKETPDFDTPMQMAGAENNAFTNPDMTNYYCLIPASNLSTALHLEADRMQDLNLSKKNLNIQKKVVIEEYKENCVNVPFGDVWHLINGLAYQTHPYRWPTIGLNEAHISKISHADALAFYDKHYTPDRAILVLGGNIDKAACLKEIKNLFEPITKKSTYQRNLTVEAKQSEMRVHAEQSKIDTKAFYLSFHIPDRTAKEFYVLDIFSDLLAGSRSSDLYQKFIKEENILSMIDCYLTGSKDPGLFVIEGKMMQDQNIDSFIDKLFLAIDNFIQNGITEKQLEKAINGIENTYAFSETNLLNRSMNLAYYEWLGDADLINTELAYYGKISVDEIKMTAAKYLSKQNASLLKYE